MAEAAISAVLSKLGELAVNEAKILLQVGDDMAFLRDRLEWLQAFIRDADRKRRAGGADQFTLVWVRQTRDAAFHAEDALDTFFYEVDLKSQGYRRWKMCRKFLTCFYTQIIIRHGLSAQIKIINTRLEKISENQKEYKIEHTPLAPVTSSTTATSAWRDDAVGFDKDVEALKKMLFDKDHPGQMFISVLGESGVGKSTLVEKIYNMKEITYPFMIKVWYMVPSDCTIENFLDSIYEQVVKEVKDDAKEGITEAEEAQSMEQGNEEAESSTRRCSAAWLTGCLHCAGAAPHSARSAAQCRQRSQYSAGRPAERAENAQDVDIADQIRALLANKKYLMVVTGLSSQTMLNCLRASLPDDGNGSRVVLVLDIESEEVAQHANTMKTDDTNRIHMLSRLDEERSGRLFCSRAFRKEEGSSSDDKEKDLIKKYSRIVYDITGGHPLAIVVLAGLLRFKERPGQWEAVLQQLRPAGPTTAGMTTMEEGEAQEGGGDNQMRSRATTQANIPSSIIRTTIERVFWESFENLPNGLKSCFLYFAAQPKDTTWFPNMIVRMWMAEGFIKPQKGKTMEELGHNYLKELILRCLVQVDATDGTGDIEEVSVHQRLHGFLLSEAREAGFMEVHDMHDVFVPPSVRRLSFMTLGGRFTTFSNKFSKLRSFICWVKEEGDDWRKNDNAGMKKHDLKFLLGSKFLRVIDIDGLRIEELPREICAMLHLRYLRVCSKNLKELPSSIWRLINLQTLDITGTQVEKIHPSFWKIKTLRHVLAEGLTLPASIDGGELDELQTLWGVMPAGEDQEWNKENCPLHKMTKLRTLNLHRIKREKHGDALENALEKMHLLRRLYLDGDELPLCIFTARGLRHLREIELAGSVKWFTLEDTLNVRVLRPNLVWLQLQDVNRCAEVPECIRKQLGDILYYTDNNLFSKYLQRQQLRAAAKVTGGASSSKVEEATP